MIEYVTQNFITPNARFPEREQVWKGIFLNFWPTAEKDKKDSYENAVIKLFEKDYKKLSVFFHLNSFSQLQAYFENQNILSKTHPANNSNIWIKIFIQLGNLIDYDEKKVLEDFHKHQNPEQQFNEKFKKVFNVFSKILLSPFNWYEQNLFFISDEIFKLPMIIPFIRMRLFKRTAKTGMTSFLYLAAKAPSSAIKVFIQEAKIDLFVEKYITRFRVAKELIDKKEVDNVILFKKLFTNWYQFNPPLRFDFEDIYQLPKLEDVYKCLHKTAIDAKLSFVDMQKLYHEKVIEPDFVIGEKDKQFVHPFLYMLKEASAEACVHYLKAYLSDKDAIFSHLIYQVPQLDLDTNFDYESYGNVKSLLWEKKHVSNQILTQAVKHKKLAVIELIKESFPEKFEKEAKRLNLTDKAFKNITSNTVEYQIIDALAHFDPPSERQYKTLAKQQKALERALATNEKTHTNKGDLLL